MKYILMVCSLLASSFALAVAYQPEGIEVTGKAAVVATPDVFSLELSVVERGVSAGKTKSLVDHKSKQLVAAAKGLGIKAQDIQSTRMNMFPIYEEASIRMHGVDVKTQFADDAKGKVHLSVNDKKDRNPKPVFEVSRKITIKLFDIELYDRLLDKVAKIGVSRISPLSMSFSNIEQLYQQALDKAILNAKQKAMKIAAQAGVSLGKLTYMKEVSYGAPRAFAMARTEARTGFDSSYGQQDVTAQVIARFKIQP